MAGGGRGRKAIGMVAGALLLTASAAVPATAALDGKDLRDAEFVNVDLPSNGLGTVGAYLSCPAGKRALNGGAFWNGAVLNSDIVHTTSSSSTFDGKGWYADGSNTQGGSHTLSVIAYCVPKRVVKGAKLKLKSFPAAAGGDNGGKVSCPRGTRVYSGGAFWHPAGLGPDSTKVQGLQLSSSYPTGNGRSWYADGHNRAAFEMTLTASVHCLPESRFERIKAKTTAVDVATGPLGINGDDVACPGKSRSLAGGAFRHRAGQKPKPGEPDDFWIKSITPAPILPSPMGYLADAYNPLSIGDIDESFKLTIVAHCLYP